MPLQKEIEQKNIPESILDQTALFQIKNPKQIEDQLNFEYSKDNIKLNRLTIGNLSIKPQEIDIEYY